MKKIALFLALIMTLGCFCALGITGNAFTGTGALTLPTTADGDGVLVGWSATVGDDTVVLAPGASYDAAEETTFTPLLIDLKTVSGASVRTVAPLGIRFTNTVGEAGYQALAATGANFELGTLIAPTDTVDGSFTIEAFAAAGKAYLTIPCQVFWSVNENERTYTGVVSHIKTENYNRAFSAVPYLRINYTDGTQGVYYGNYDPTANSRAVYTVACDALADTSVSYTESAQSYLQSIFDTVGVDISITVPVVGGKPELAVSNVANARYTVTTAWMCQFVSKMHETFIDNNGYQATITVTGIGAEINENTVLTFNGAPLEAGRYTLKDGVLTIVRRYPLGNYTWAY